MAQAIDDPTTPAARERRLKSKALRLAQKAARETDPAWREQLRHLALNAWDAARRVHEEAANVLR